MPAGSRVARTDFSPAISTLPAAVALRKRTVTDLSIFRFLIFRSKDKNFNGFIIFINEKIGYDL